MGREKIASETTESEEITTTPIADEPAEKDVEIEGIDFEDEGPDDDDDDDDGDEEGYF